MKYLTQVSRSPNGFLAKLTNGATTTSHDAASFFMVMQDKGVTAEHLESHIGLGEMVDTGHDWQEIRRIAATFTKARAA
jgi:hypothetical protein